MQHKVPGSASRTVNIHCHQTAHRAAHMPNIIATIIIRTNIDKGIKSQTPSILNGVPNSLVCQSINPRQTESNKAVQISTEAIPVASATQVGAVRNLAM